MIAYHYAVEELRYDETSNMIEGTVVRYGDKALVPLKNRFGHIVGIADEVIRAGAFSDSLDDVTLNIGHQKSRVFARTGGGGLELVDTPEALTMRCEVPDTLEGKDAKTYLENGTLRGLSVEMNLKPGGLSLDRSAEVRPLREITSAKLNGIGIVDRPAYKDSGVMLVRADEIQADDTADPEEGSRLEVEKGVLIETIYTLADGWQDDWYDKLTEGENVVDHIPDGWQKDKPETRAIMSIYKSTRKVEIVGGKFVGATRWSYPDMIQKAETDDRSEDTGDNEFRFESSYLYDDVEVISDSGAVRKREISPGAFDVSIRDPQQEITLSVGRNPNDAIGSKLDGTLILDQEEGRLIARVDNPPDTTSFKDLQARLAAGASLYMEPLFRELDGGYEDRPEPGNPSTTIRRYTGAKLYGLALSVRGKKGQTASDENRAEWRRQCLSAYATG